MREEANTFYVIVELCAGQSFHDRGNFAQSPVAIFLLVGHFDIKFHLELCGRRIERSADGFAIA